MSLTIADKRMYTGSRRCLRDCVTMAGACLANLALLPGLVLITACASPDFRAEAGAARHGGDPADQPGNFQFVIVGDRTGGHRPGVFRHAVDRINLLQPEFVVGVGDLIEGYKDDTAALKQEWDEFDRIIGRLDMPFFYTVGNHDIGNEPSRDLWHQRYGRDYYYFIYRDVLFLSLNTEDPPVILPPDVLARQAALEEMMQRDPAGVRRMLRERRRDTGAAEGPPKLPGAVAISAAQEAWVAQTLAAFENVRWTIVLMHKPAWEYGSAAFERIEQLLADRPYTVIAGHEHYYNYTRRNDSDYVTMATTGGIWLHENGGAFDHIAWVSMTDEGPIISNIALCGLLGTPRETLATMGTADDGHHCFRPGGMTP